MIVIKNTDRLCVESRVEPVSLLNHLDNRRTSLDRSCNKYCDLIGSNDTKFSNNTHKLCFFLQHTVYMYTMINFVQLCRYQALSRFSACNLKNREESGDEATTCAHTSIS